MGILDSIVEWIATQIMNLLDLVTGSVLGALGCDMSTFLRYFPAAETLYEVFVAIAVGFILLNLVWQLFKNFGLGVGLSAEDPTNLAIKSILFIFLALFADQIMVLILGIAGTPYDWVVDTALPPIEFSNFGSVLTVKGLCMLDICVKLIAAQNIVVLALMAGDLREGKKFILRHQLRAEGEDNLLCLVQRDDAVEVCHCIEIFAQEARGRVLQRDFPIPGVQLPACVFLRELDVLFLAHVFPPSV